MTGHRPFGELTKGYAQERRARAAAKAAALNQSITREVGKLEAAKSEQHGDMEGVPSSLQGDGNGDSGRNIV